MKSVLLAAVAAGGLLLVAPASAQGGRAYPPDMPGKSPLPLPEPRRKPKLPQS